MKTVMTLSEFERFVKTECCGTNCTFASVDQDDVEGEYTINVTMDFPQVLVFPTSNLKCIMLKNDYGFIRMDGVLYVELENIGPETAVVAVCGGFNGISERRYRFYFSAEGGA